MAIRPVITDVHIDKALTNFSLEYKSTGFVAEELFPVKQVKNSSDKYFKYGSEVFEIQNTELTPKSVANDFEYTITTSTYTLGLHGLGGFIPQEVIDNSDEPLDAEKDMTKFLTEAILRTREYITASIATNPLNYPDGHSESLSGGNKWSDYTNSNPLKKVMDMRSVIRKKIGIVPNVMLVSGSVFEILVNHPVIRDAIKYVKMAIPSEEDMANLFRVEKFVVANAIYKTNSNSSDIWNNCVILARVSEPSVMSTTFGVMFQKSDGRSVIVENYLHPRGKRIIVEDKFIPSIVMGEAGYLLSSVI